MSRSSIACWKYWPSQSGNLLNVAELSNTCALARPTIERYLFLLEQTYIIRLVRPFSRNLRTEISKMPKIFLCDTGLMQMLWLKRLQREVLGPVFETSIYAELLKRYAADQIGYWRTTDKKEIDFILQPPRRTTSRGSQAQLPPCNASGHQEFP